jgi:type IV secretory pathway VirB4 component
MSAPKLAATTQEHLDIYDVKDNFVILKNGIVCSILQTNAVNFDLLSEIEQDAIIAAFSMLLNSITFPIQIVIRSKRLDITKYIEKVQRIENKISDPLLKHQAEAYRKFVQDVIQNNDVLDKRFYVVIPTGGGNEARPGSGPFDWIFRLAGSQNKRYSFDSDQTLKDGKIELFPKIDHVIKEFNRIGVRARQLTTQEIVELYFDIYNPSTVHGQRIRTNVEDYKTAIVNPAIIEE